MSNLTIVGIDPGVVHTGLVCITFLPEDKTIRVESQVFEGVKAEAIAAAAELMLPDDIYIEDYSTRKNFNNDSAMELAVVQLKQAMPEAKLIDNAGVATLVTPATMQVFGVWHFQTPTHHQDLRSAARIALLGMLKNQTGQRELLSLVVKNYLDGNDWDVVVKPRP